VSSRSVWQREGKPSAVLTNKPTCWNCSCLTSTEIRSTIRYSSSPISTPNKFSLSEEPLVKELMSDGTATFHFIHGPHEASPPPEFEEYFGGKPYYRFTKQETQEGTNVIDALDRLRDFPDGGTAEDALREFVTEGYEDGNVFASVRGAMSYLDDILEDEGPFDGIIGYSEGATVAATFLLTEQERAAEEGRAPRIKFAVFFAGWPPVRPDADQMVLCDETDLVLQVPSCHVGE
jgi:hypothetical protein